MKLTVFGATGRTGIEVVKQALEQGHEVVAFVRTPSKMTLTHDNLTLVQGDAMNATDVEQAITEDTDAVISVLAPTKDAPPDMLPQAANNILSAMRTHGVERLLYMTGAGVRDPKDEPGLFDNVIRLALKTLSGDVLRQSEEAVEQVRSSSLDWTIVRAPMLTDDEHSGEYRVGWVGVNTGPRLARSDAADFILTQVDDTEYRHMAPVVSN